MSGAPTDQSGQQAGVPDPQGLAAMMQAARQGGQASGLPPDVMAAIKARMAVRPSASRGMDPGINMHFPPGRNMDPGMDEHMPSGRNMDPGIELTGLPGSPPKYRPGSFTANLPPELRGGAGGKPSQPSMLASNPELQALIQTLLRGQR
jgi:hypothetical protein